MGKIEITAGKIEVWKTGVGEIKKVTHHHSLYTDLIGQLGACRKIPPAILFWLLKWTHEWSSWRGLWKLSFLLKVYSSAWGHCCLTRLVVGRMIWKLETARHLYINLLRAMASAILPSSNLMQIPPSVSANLKPIRKSNCGKYFSSFRLKQ